MSILYHTLGFLRKNGPTLPPATRSSISPGMNWSIVRAALSGVLNALELVRSGQRTRLDGGTITEAVSTQVWPGEAVVHVSIVNWVKGKAPGRKMLSWQEGDNLDSPWAKANVDVINPTLSTGIDLTSSVQPKRNAKRSWVRDVLWDRDQG